ncbi:hypothetical protein P9Z80_21885, partial [Bacillus cereus]|nr:hypothetical protein [Bacillus cereus]
GGKIHGDHIITAKMSAEMEKKFRSSTVNPALYAPFLSQKTNYEKSRGVFYINRGCFSKKGRAK